MATKKQKLLFAAIQAAIQANDIKSISKLIRANAKDKEFLKGQDEQGNNILAIAIKYSNNEATLNSVLAGIDSELLKTLLMQPNKQGQSVLMHYTEPTESELAASLDVDSPPLKPNFKAVLKSIHSTGKLEPDDWVNIFSLKQSGNSPLHIWVAQGKSDQAQQAVNFLHSVSNEAAEKVLNQKNSSRDSVLDVANFLKQAQLVQAIQSVQEENRAPVEDRSAPVVKTKPPKGFFGKAKGTLEKRKQEKRKGRLYDAIKTNNIEKIKSRLEKHPELLNSTDNDGNNVLGLAFKHANDTQTIESVIKAFPDSQALKEALMHRNHKGEVVLACCVESTPEELELAIAGQKKIKLTVGEILKTVNSIGNLNSSDWEAILNTRQTGNHEGNTILHSWADSGKDQHIEAVLGVITDPAFSKGSAQRILNTENLDGRTPLGLAIYHGQQYVVERFIGKDSKLSLDQKDAILPPRDKITSYNDWVPMSSRSAINTLMIEANEQIDAAKKVEVLPAPIEIQIKAFSWRDKLKSWLANIFSSAKDPNIQTPRSSITTETSAVEPAREVLPRRSDPTPTPKPTDPFSMEFRLHAYDKAVKDQPSTTQRFAPKSKEAVAEAKRKAKADAKAAKADAKASKSKISPKNKS